MISVATGSVLVSADGDDEDTVIFIDNSEDDNVVNVAEGAVLQGEDGVIFQEGDGLILTNAGTIEGTGAANEGVIYFDRDSDGTENVVDNSGTITGVGGPTIGVDTLLGNVSGNRDDATAEEPVVFGGGAVLTITNSGTISNTSTGSNADAINFNGDPGNTSEGSLGGSSANPRGCLENVAGVDAPLVNCQVNFTLTNSGTISTASTDTGSAAIRSEADAVINGSITNTADGVITGASRGIFINGAHADHDLDIANAGTISGTGESAVGVLITGAGVDVNNSGTISGTDVGLQVASTTITVREVDRAAENNASIGDARDVEDVAVAAVNNTFVNSGTISGATASVDLSGAGEAVTFEQQGGALIGNFLGSTEFADQLNFTTSDFQLNYDVLQSVNVSVGSGVSLSFGGEGARTIDGNFVSDGDLSFDIGNPATVVTGDVTLNSGSTVSIADAGNVRALDTNYTLIDVGGTLSNNASLVNQIEDESFLIDFEVVEGSEDLVVRATFNQPELEFNDVLSSLNDANLSSFGQSVIGAFNNGALNNTDAFSALAGLSTQAAVESEVTRLIPNLGNIASQETNQALVNIGGLIDGRIADLTVGKSFANRTTQYASNGLNNLSGGDQSPLAGAWTRGGFHTGDQDNRAGDFGLNDGYDSNIYNIALGYDVALGGDALIGLSGGYVRLTTESDRESNDSVDVDLYQITGYAAKLIQGWEVSGQASYAFGEAETQRFAFERISGEYDVDALTFEGHVRKAFDFDGNNYAAPYVGLRYSAVGTDAYTEDGGLDISIDDTDENYLQGQAGLTVGHRIIKADTAADIFLGLGLVNEFNDGSSELDIAFADQALTLNTAEVDDLRFNPSVGFNWSSNQGVAVGAVGEAEFGDTYSSYSLSGRVKFSF